MAALSLLAAVLPACATQSLQAAPLPEAPGAPRHRAPPSDEPATLDPCSPAPETRGLREQRLEDAPNQFSHTVVKHKEGEEPQGHYVRIGASLPTCDVDESEICNRLAEDAKAATRPLVFFLTDGSVYDVDKDEITGYRPSLITAFYVDSVKEMQDGMKASAHYRPKRQALSGHYLKDTPVGVWHLWSEDGALVGYTDFETSDAFVACEAEVGRSGQGEPVEGQRP